MKKNTKNLIAYIVVLFAFALMLILFAGLTQNDKAKVEAESKGMKNNLINLTETNQALTDSVNLLNTELKESKTKIGELVLEKETTEKLIQILELYEKGNIDEAKEKKASFNADSLTQTQLYIYNKIK